MILEESKKVSVDVVFSRTALDPRTLKNVSAFFLKTVTFEIWNQKEMENLSLIKMLGHGIEKTRVIRVFLKMSFPDRVITQELDFHTKVNGLSISETSEQRLTKKKALELIESLRVRVFDNEELFLSQIPH